MKRVYYLIFIIFVSFQSSTYAMIEWNEVDKASKNANFILNFFSAEMFINFAFAIIVIISTIAATKIADSKIRRFLETSWDWENREELAWVLTRTSNIAIISIWFSITLGILWVDMWIFLWGLGIWIWFTMKIFLSNFIAWIIMVTNWTYHNWDIIEIEDRSWTIKKINSLFTEVEQFDWIIFFVPNLKFLENNVQNFHSNDKRRVDIDIWVDYDTDLLKAKKILLQILQNFPNILKAPAPSIFITSFDSSSINISLRFWVDSKNWDFFGTKSNVTETINMAFKQAWIVIPFPQITLSNRSDFKIGMQNI